MRRLQYFWLLLRNEGLGEALADLVAWLLPRRVVYHAVIRLWAHGTTGKWGNTTPDGLGWSEAIKRWEWRA